ncbi:MAG: DUF6789 family protein [Lautropia sp.]
MNQFVKGMAAGLIATVVLSVLMIVKAMMGVMSSLDIRYSIPACPETIRWRMGWPSELAGGWS